MKKYIFRNTAIEYLFNENYNFSGYSDVSVDDIYDEYYFCYFIDYSNSKNEILNCIKKAKFNFDFITKNIKDKKIYVLTLYNYFNSSFILSDNEIEKEISKFNEYIYNFKNNVYVIDIKNFFVEYSPVFDERFYYNYNAIISPKLKIEFANWFDKQYKLINETRKKCLIVDFDNTIWNGVLGEDGIEGIGFNGSYPNNIYGEVQKIIKQLKDNGIIICAATKNNPEDIDELFDKRKDLYLTKDDFTIIKSGWDNKVNSIMEIVKQLNIGMDSVVFIDDNNFEIELVKKSLDSIVAILLPEEKYKIPSTLVESFKDCFSIYELSNEDMEKNKMYKNMQEAEKLKLSITDYDTYLKELYMKLEINYMNDLNIDRIVQLINKSNQFNLTAKRYTKEELLNNTTDKDFVYCVRISDRFGDLGICGVCIIKNDNNCYYIDEYLLSCRVLGRTIENEFLKVILNDLYSKNINTINSEYIKTNKNSQVADFYDKFGFNKYEESDTNKKYNSNIEKYDLNDNMEVAFNEK